MQSLHLPFKAPTEQVFTDENTSDHALVVHCASGVAIPVSKNRTAEQLRDLVTEDTIRNLTAALAEETPCKQA